MKRVNYYSTISFIAVIFLMVWTVNVYAVKLIFPPPVLNVEYEGSADVPEGIREFLIKELSGTGKFDIEITDTKPAYSEFAGKKEDAYIVNLKIKKYYVKFWNMDVGNAGGYRKLRCIIGIEVNIVDCSQGITKENYYKEIERADNEYGVSFTKKFDAGRDYESEMQDLFDKDYRDEGFNRTIIYRTITPLINKICSKINFIFYNKPYGLKGKIIEARGKKAHINLGYEDDIVKGDTCVLYMEKEPIKDSDSKKVIGFTETKRIGVIKIDKVMKTNLSSGKIVSGKSEIKLNDFVVFE